MEHFEVDLTLHPNLVDLLWSTHRQRIDDYHKHTVGEDYTNLDILILDSNEPIPSSKVLNFFNDLLSVFPMFPGLFVLNEIVSYHFVLCYYNIIIIFAIYFYIYYARFA